ncbi:hypothetical protein SVAN01_11261 [Stagonosporopsis vannaccii]|nr:hypothetical protein SVAN01_11261 [Stagonosporopsis vannaccii]
MLTSTINPYPVEQQGSNTPHPTTSSPGLTSNASPSQPANAAAAAAAAAAAIYPPVHRRKTRSEDLHILSHAQGQLREHLEPPGSATYALQNPSSQRRADEYRAESQLLARLPPAPLPSGACAPRPRSAHQFRHVHDARDPSLRAAAVKPPFRWWERGLLSSDAPCYDDPASFENQDEDDADEIRPSIEAPDEVLESIETDAHAHSHSYAAVSPMSGVAEETGASEDDARRAGEAQMWRGYVQHRESWVRRAGLKREREERVEHGGRVGAKRGRSGV